MTIIGGTILQISINIDDNQPTYEFFDEIVIHNLKLARECLLLNTSENPEDQKLVIEMLKAFNLVLNYYGVMYD